MTERDEKVLQKLKDYPIYQPGYELFRSLYDLLSTTGMTNNYKEYVSDGYGLYVDLYLNKPVDKWIRR